MRIVMFDNNLSVIGNIKKDSSRLNALRVLCNEFGRGGPDDEHGDTIIAVCDDNPRLAPFKSYLVCASCRESLVNRRVPSMSVSFGYRYPPRPAHLPDLNTVEERLISPRLPFMSIRRLTRGNGQFGIKGQVVNVPIDVPSVVECLPRMVPEDVVIDVHVKRRLVSPATYKRGLVKRSNILAWLKHLQHTPLYRAINVRFDWSRLDYFDGDETAERKREGEEERKEDDDDDEIETIPQDFDDEKRGDEIETIPQDRDVNDPLQLAIALNAVSKTMFFNEEGDDGPGVYRVKEEEEREQEQRERERDANEKKKKKPRMRIVMFDNNLSVIGNIKKDSSRLNALRVLCNEFGRGGPDDEHGDTIIAVCDDNPRLAPFKSYLVCASFRDWSTGASLR
ncbi:hypothetical protein HPB49_025331 [Dermacentor silvarum]|uniref:Uncharacterized protein n=1 Tax=Dermacentor silvarum TaxID=543639 RepID=A0ACB8CTN7_DERSI|nr:hypothetical protein HPB49_025331 [Dermacentor silvarum]